MAADPAGPAGDHGAESDGAGRASAGSRVARYLVTLLLVVCVLAWQAGVFTPKIRAGQTDRPATAAEVPETMVVAAWQGGGTRHLVGSVVARARVELAPEIAGRIAELRVAAGDRVEAGETLATLDARTVDAQLAQADAALARARAEARGAERLLASVREAAAARSVPQTDLIDAERGREAARRGVEEARAARDGARARRDFAQLVSPIDGVVIDTLADPGDLAAPERPVLLLHRPEALEVAVSVPAALASRVSPGAPLAIHLPELDAAVDGTVRTVTAAADPLTRTVLARITAPLPEAVIAGMFVEVRLPVSPDARPPGSVRVPAQALERVRQLTFVHVLEDDGRIARRLVRLGTTVGDGVLVLAGLRPGERILMRPPAITGAGDE